jgi:DNA replication and repair protein RecF
MNSVIKSLRKKEILQGITLCGPHRDDIEILIDGVNADAFGSRGQSRTGILSMKLAQASHFKKIRNQEPVILLDDILSELDNVRRNQILSKAEQFEQCFVTTADINSMNTSYVERSKTLRVHAGTISASSR